MADATGTATTTATTTGTGAEVVEYADRDERGRYYTLADAREGWLVAEHLRLGDIATGVILEVRGRAFRYRPDGGRPRWVGFGDVFGVARPVYRDA